MFLMVKNLFAFYIPKSIFVISSLQLSRSSTKRKFLCCATFLTALILLIVSRDLVLLRCLFLRPSTHSLTEDR